jgi:hypothetical protein
MIKAFVYTIWLRHPMHAGFNKNARWVHLGLAGLDPCPELQDHGGIWQFDAGKIGLTQKDGKKFATVLEALSLWTGTLQMKIYIL